jgi:hypothetical protein
MAAEVLLLLAGIMLATVADYGITATVRHRYGASCSAGTRRSEPTGEPSPTSTSRETAAFSRSSPVSSSRLLR